MAGDGERENFHRSAWPRPPLAGTLYKRAVLYRMRAYRAVPASLPAFHQFFREYLLPVQLRYGARLIGRWETEDGRVIAVWEYDDRGSYEQIEAAVRADPDSRRAQEYRRTSLPELFTSMEETFMTSATG
jgi:hypothetical protein